MFLRSVFVALVCLTAVACGEEIGDECVLSSDCSPQGDRICDVNSPNGYCTILGCDVGTCPDEAVCVRFFPVQNTNRLCDPDATDGGASSCSADEVCTFSGTCAPRSAEVRFCMKTCGDNGDCRDEYECRDAELMKSHGGEPVPEVGDPTGSKLTNFCAAEPQ